MGTVETVPSESGPAWYSVREAPPPLGVRVLISWASRPPFEAARAKHPRTGAVAWLTHERGAAVWLPTDAPPPDRNRPWVGWHTLRDAPEYWRPLHPEKWELPLPFPAFVETVAAAPVRMWSQGQRFTAADSFLDAADASELAAEMERDRDDARAGGQSREADTPDAQWWIDPHTVSYSAPGAISAREAEGRLMRALATERWVRADRPSSRTFGDVLAQLAKANPMTAAELAAEDLQPVKAEPTGRDWDDMLTALAWLQAMPSTAHETTLRQRAANPPLGWRRIGRAIGRSQTAAREIYREALLLACAAANGQRTAAGGLRRQALEQLRHRNRQPRG